MCVCVFEPFVRQYDQFKIQIHDIFEHFKMKLVIQTQKYTNKEIERERERERKEKKK